VVLGGSMSVYDDLDFIKNEIEFVRKRIETGGKVFGICIARNDAFENQAFATVDGRIIATQFHFETTAESMEKQYPMQKKLKYSEILKQYALLPMPMAEILSRS